MKERFVEVRVCRKCGTEYRLGDSAFCPEHGLCRAKCCRHNVVDAAGYEHVAECHQRLMRCVCTHNRPPYDEPMKFDASEYDGSPNDPGKIEPLCDTCGKPNGGMNLHWHNVTTNVEL